MINKWKVLAAVAVLLLVGMIVDNLDMLGALIESINYGVVGAGLLLLGGG